MGKKFYEQHFPDKVAETALSGAEGQTPGPEESFLPQQVPLAKEPTEEASSSQENGRPLPELSGEDSIGRLSSEEEDCLIGSPNTESQQSVGASWSVDNNASWSSLLDESGGAESFGDTRLGSLIICLILYCGIIVCVVLLGLLVYSMYKTHSN